MLQLDESLLIGRGSHKKCYLHPADRRRCVKVNWRDSVDRDLEREIRYRALLARRKKDTPFLTGYFGTVETNLGTGWVFETILDRDGKISRPLSTFLDDGDLLEGSLPALAESLRRLKAELMDGAVATMAVRSVNILMQDVGGGFRARIIDDIGSGSAIPLEYYFGFFARKRLERRWGRFMTRTLEHCPGPAGRSLVEAIR